MSDKPIDMEKLKRWCPEMVGKRHRDDAPVLITPDFLSVTDGIKIARRVVELGECVEKYAWHKDNCSAFIPEEDEECSCGYAEVIARLEEGK